MDRSGAGHRGRARVRARSGFLAPLLSRDLGSSASLYQPRELVAGGDEPRRRASLPSSSRSTRVAAVCGRLRWLKGLHRAHRLSRHDHIVFEKYWHGTGFDTVEDGQSLSRVVVALAAGVAVARGRSTGPMSRIGNFITQWKDDPRGAITINQLLKMSSGLSAPEPSLVPWKASVRGALGSDIDAVHLAAPLVGKPGATWADQSADPQLAALVSSAPPACVTRSLCRRHSGGPSGRATPGCGSTVRGAPRMRTVACWRVRVTGFASPSC